MRIPLVPLAALLLAACSSADRGDAPAPPADSTAPAPAPALRDTVVLETSRGSIVLELDPSRAPETVANFLKHVRAGFYNGLIFHRVEANFVIQAGAVTEDARERTSSIFPLRNEAQNGLKNGRGTVAMARTGDPHSATSEFFINLKDNVGLDHTAPTLEGWGYAVFGRVIDGMAVVDAIAATPTTRRGVYRTYPTEPTVIRRAYVGAPPVAPTP
jgi:cyclophilin family peptidyl-prolyl cis-trans isomerase